MFSFGILSRRAALLFLLLLPGTALLPVHLRFNRIFLQKEDLYAALKLHDKGLSRSVFDLALRGYSQLCFEKKIYRQGIISIADFSRSSAFPRLYVVDLEKRSVLFHTLVAHGKNSGEEYACAFGNKPNSFRSSLGFFVTGQTYKGRHGISLRLAGCEPGINDNAEARGIVMHGAGYVSEEFVASNGRLGRSHGCPAVPGELCKPIVDCIKDGTCLFLYYPDSTYINQSRLLR